MTSAALRRTAVLLFTLLLVSVVCFSAYTQGIEFADGLSYNDFFAITVFHSDGESYTIFDAASFEGEVPPWPDNEGNFGAVPGSNPGAEMKYFFWIRRIGDTGAVTYPLSFRKIRQIRFTGLYGGNVANLPQDAVLTLGEEERRVAVRIPDGVNSQRFTGWFGIRQPHVPSFKPAVITLTDGTEQNVFVKTDGFLGGIDEEFGTYAMLWIQHDSIDRLVFEHNGTYARCPECGAIFFDNRYEQCPFDGTTLIPPAERQ